MFDKRKDVRPPTQEHARVVQQSSGSRVAGSEPEATRVPTGQGNRAPKAVISATIVVKGELSGDEDVVIAGEFEGGINLPNNSLTVKGGGRVNADVRADVVEIEGELRGDVVGGDKVVITKTGRMQGNIVSSRVILDDGAKFKGSIDMDPGQALPIKSTTGSAATKPAAVRNRAPLPKTVQSSAKS